MVEVIGGLLILVSFVLLVLWISSKRRTYPSWNLSVIMVILLWAVLILSSVFGVVLTLEGLNNE
jgi:hypothetical protein